MSAAEPSDAGSPLTEAQESFARWLEGVELGGAADFEAWCADRRELEAELRRLHASWSALQRAMAALDEPPKQDDWITLAGASPPRDASGPESERELGARSLLARLRARSAASDRYRIEAELGRGAEGVVYRAQDHDLGRTLAIKVMHTSVIGLDEHGVRRAELARVVRFLAEASVTAKLDHPGIVPVHDVGVDAQGRLFFTMKLVEERRLDQVFERAWSRSGGWDTGRIVNVFLRLCEAVEFAHARGVVHRDLKPSNVLVGEFGEVYVMDWGLALVRERQPDSASLLAGTTTRSGSSRPVGTAPYFAPEQARGDGTGVDERADVYALGALLYQFLAHRPPYVDAGQRVTRGELVRRVIETPPENLARLAPRAPHELVAIVKLAMEREPSARYATAKAFAEDLLAFQQFRKGQAWRDGPLSALQKAVRRHPAITAGIVCALIAAPILARLASLASDSTELARRNRVLLVDAQLARIEELDDRFSAEFDSTQRGAPPALEVLALQVDATARLGFPLRGAVDPVVYRARYDELQRDDSRVGPAITRRLLGLRSALELVGAAHGARALAGHLPKHLGQKTRTLAADMAHDQPQLCEAYANLVRVLADLPLSEGQRRFVELSDAYYERRERPNVELLESTWTGTPDELLMLAPLLSSFVDSSDGDRWLERLAQLHPDAAAVRQTLAWRYLARTPPVADLAESHASAYAALVPRSAHSLDLWASAVQVNGHPRLALSLQRTALLLDDHSSAQWSSRLLTNLARIHLDLDEDSQALNAAEQACSLPGAAAQAYLNRCVAYSRLGGDEEALTSITAALNLDPSYAKAWYWKARCLVMLDRFDEAMEAHAQAPELESNPHFWLLMHGQVLLDNGDDARAQCVYERARELYPTSAKVRAGLARALSRRGEFAAALNCLRGNLGDAEARAAYVSVLASEHALALAADQLAKVLLSVHMELDGPQVLQSRERIEFVEHLLSDPRIAPLWNASAPSDVVDHVRALRKNAESLLEVARSMRP